MDDGAPQLGLVLGWGDFEGGDGHGVFLPDYSRLSYGVEDTQLGPTTPGQE